MTDEEIQQILRELAGCYGMESMPKYIVLGDGVVYFYKKEEDRYALCDQTPSVQEGIHPTESPR